MFWSTRLKEWNSRSRLESWKVLLVKAWFGQNLCLCICHYLNNEKIVMIDRNCIIIQILVLFISIHKRKCLYEMPFHPLLIEVKFYFSIKESHQRKQFPWKKKEYGQTWKMEKLAHFCFKMFNAQVQTWLISLAISFSAKPLAIIEIVASWSWWKCSIILCLIITNHLNSEYLFGAFGPW